MHAGELHPYFTADSAYPLPYKSLATLARHQVLACDWARSVARKLTVMILLPVSLCLL